MSRNALSRALVAALALLTTSALAQVGGTDVASPPAGQAVTSPTTAQPSEPTGASTPASGTNVPSTGAAPAAPQGGMNVPSTASDPGAPATPQGGMNVPSTDTATAQQPVAPIDGAAAQQPAAPVDGATAQQPVAPVDGATAQQPVAPADGATAQPGEAAPSEATAAESDAMSDEAMLAESAEPPAGFTGIYGKVVDEANQEGLIEATVKVVSGAQKQVLTDLDGNYRLALPPGKYDLRVFYDVYQGRRITGVVVAKGKATKLDVALSADVGAVQEVVVEARADRRAEGALLQERKKAATVSDAISAQEIARTPDSAASDAVKRVVSATVVDGRYVYLRGLGGRYVTTLLNGTLVPSPEPDEPSVPLDLFPTALLANLTVQKTYNADMPGAFGGGALSIETNSYPSQFEFKPRLSLGGNTVTTGQVRNAQPGGGGLELLGFPSSDRQLPEAIPTDHALGANGETSEQLERQWESFPNVWNARRKTALPNMGLSASLGDTKRFGNSRLGYLATLGYSHEEYALVTSYARASFDPAGQLEANDDAQVTQGVETASLSGLANVSYQFDRDNELTVLSLYTRSTDTGAFTGTGVDAIRGERYEGTRLQFISRELFFNQLRGFHRVGLFNDAEVDWQANISRVNRDEPDTRDTLYSDSLSTPNGVLSFPDQANSGERFFSDLGETSGGGSLNFTVPLTDVRLKVGGLAQVSARDFSARRFRYNLFRGADVDRTLEPEQLFDAEHLGVSMRVRESTRPDTDAYDASLAVLAGYVSADVKPTEALRLVGGLRLETSRQELTAVNQFTGAVATNNEVSYLDWLPSFNATYALTPEVNLRAGYSYTLARPTFRELAPFAFYDFVRRRNVSGNPDLKQTRIHNVDTRVEWFVGENEVLAASAFYKRFENPIERVINSTEAYDTNFENAPAADNFGVELEGRASLARLTESLRDFRVGANLTLVRSEIDLGELKGLQTSAQRPMAGQSPYVVNVNLGYARAESGTEVALLYNVYGPRIIEVGIEGLPDVYERPFHRVDLALIQRLGAATQLKLTAANLLDSKVSLKQGDIAILQYRPGLAFSASFGLSL